VFENKVVLIKGGGEQASGVAMRLWRAGFRIIMTELEQPLSIRRLVSFSEAVYNGQIQVEEITAVRVNSLAEIESAWEQKTIPILADPTAAIRKKIHPAILVDAIMAKKNTGATIGDAEFVIGLGPGFCAGKDVHVSIETNRGHYLGRVIWEGCAEKDTGTPGEIKGVRSQRVVYSPAAGILNNEVEIGEMVIARQLLGNIDGVPFFSEISGVLRGIIHPGIMISEHVKIADIDPRGKPEYCSLISEKALAIGGGVLEAILVQLNKTGE
jgi:xanthine dehydrogenase accessory factor